MVLNYFELPEEEIPDERIWHHPARLEEWFAAIKQRRENPDMEPVPQADEEPGMTNNELTRELMGG